MNAADITIFTIFAGVPCSDSAEAVGCGNLDGEVLPLLMSTARLGSTGIVDGGDPYGLGMVRYEYDGNETAMAPVINPH
jgi:hypothetical protein